MFRFRTSLPSDGGGLFRAVETLESIVSTRLDMEKDSTPRNDAPLREARILYDRLSLTRVELVLSTALKEVS